MHWEKLGQIFRFDTSPFKARFVSHAQSPQALVLGDRVRVYFSTRRSDAPGKFISEVQYVDFDETFNVVGASEHQVIPTGALGCFDEHGIFPLSPTRVGEQVYGYTNGISRRVSVAVETGIGFAVSTDGGRTFKKRGDGPLLSASLHEAFMVGDAFVRVFDGTFHMFYLFGKKWSEPTATQAAERVYKIAHATSRDGLDWARDGRHVITDVLDENECQALPTVFQRAGRFHMYFCYRHMIGFRAEQGRGYRLGYASSDDLSTWVRDDAQAGIDLSPSGWDDSMMCYPNVFEWGGSVFMLYNGNDFGRHGFGIARLTN
jgi:hypothetical protein